MKEKQNLLDAEQLTLAAKEFTVEVKHWFTIIKTLSLVCWLLIKAYRNGK
ncbi:hypothetical protein ACS5PU_14005 [Pedobacter sp. GSP4]